MQSPSCVATGKIKKNTYYRELSVLTIVYFTTIKTLEDVAKLHMKIRHCFVLCFLL